MIVHPPARGRRSIPGRAVALASAMLAAVAVLPAGSAAAHAVEPRLNQIQVIGTHNSYHLEPSSTELGLMTAVAGSQASGLQYSHPPLQQQFAGQHVRQIELDVYADPDGGRYARPVIRRLTGQPAEYDPRLKKPGTKVLHIAGLDYRSNCLTLVDCLTAVRQWSQSNPGHLPLAILLEFQDTLGIPTPSGVSIPLVTWTRERMLAVEQEIRSVFGPDDLITPDTVRKPGRTLEQSVLDGGWPTLSAARGKVMFLMDNAGVYRDRYIQGNPNLEGRILFTNSEPGRPDAAFVKRNNPTDSGIRDLVAKGYLVRTRADVGTAQARTGDTAMRDAALASGAQWVSTDYPVPGLAARFGTGYYAALPGFVPVRCNPVNAPPGCAVTGP